jgi:cytochrome c1
MVQWIKNPQAFDPATLMPNLGVSDAEAIALVAYLESVSRQMTAQAEPRPAVGRLPSPNQQ